MMYDLAALSNYQHYLNEFGTDLAITEFVKLDLATQCMIAERWRDGQDYQADRKNAEGQWT